MYKYYFSRVHIWYDCCFVCSSGGSTGRWAALKHSIIWCRTRTVRALSSFASVKLAMWATYFQVWDYWSVCVCVCHLCAICWWNNREGNMCQFRFALSLFLKNWIKFSRCRASHTSLPLPLLKSFMTKAVLKKKKNYLKSPFIIISSSVHVHSQGRQLRKALQDLPNGWAVLHGPHQ